MKKFEHATDFMPFPLSVLKNSRFLSAGLSAVVLALVLCPYVYLGMGALSHFSPLLTVLLIPPLLAGSGFLLNRFFFDSLLSSRKRLAFWLEILSWVCVACSTALLARFTLMTVFETIGLFCAVFTVSCSICAIFAWRAEPLRSRFSRWPDTLAFIVLFGILLSCGGIALAFALKTPAFPG